MGSSINVIEPAGRFSLDASGSTWFWNTGAVSADGKHMYVSGKPVYGNLKILAILGIKPLLTPVLIICQFQLMENKYMV